MTYINIKAVSFPAGQEAMIEKRFAKRPHQVEWSDGFQGFEFWRPVVGENRYFVLTRWDSQEAFDTYVANRGPHGHAAGSPSEITVELLGFEVVQNTAEEHPGSSFVNATALTFPAGAEAEIEKRFAARDQKVDGYEGFQSFELWRPVAGENRYFVLTRWDSQENFNTYVAGRDERAHDEDQARGMAVDLLGFEVVESTDDE